MAGSYSDDDYRIPVDDDDDELSIANEEILDAVEVDEEDEEDGELSAEDHLQRLCDAVLSLAKSGAEGGSILAQVLPSLIQAIGSCGQGAIPRLQQDLNVWAKSSEQLGQMALLHCGGDAQVLLGKLERTREQAGRVIDALDALQAACPPPPAASRPEPSRPGPMAYPSSGADGTPAIAGNAGGQASPLPAQLVDLERAAALFQRAEQHLQNQDFAAAETLYTDALTVDPGLRLAYLHRGRARLMLRRPAQAIEDFTLAAQLNAHDPLAYGWRGDAYAVGGRFEEAIADYTRALELSPDLILMRYNRAVALRQAGQLDRALAEFDQLVRIKPSHGPFYLNRGLIWLTQSDLPRAAAEFRMALRHQPNSQEAVERLREIDARLMGVPYVPATAAGADADAPVRSNPLLEELELPEVEEPPPEVRPAPALHLPAPQGHERPTAANPPPGAVPQHRRNLPAVNQRPADRDTRPLKGRGRKRRRRDKTNPVASPPPAVDPDSFSDAEIAHALEAPPEPEPVPVRRPAATTANLSAATAATDMNTALAPTKPDFASSTSSPSPPRTTPTYDPGAVPGSPSAAQPGSSASIPVAPGPMSGHSSPPSAASTLDALQVQMFSFKCPACEKVSMVRWDKLQIGKILSCPGCQRSFTTVPGGRIAQVERDSTGKWKERSRKLSPTKIYRLSLGAAAMIAVMLLVAFVPGLFHGSAADDAGLPKELVPRAQAFAMAWLKGDYRIMRVLSDPAQGQELFSWYQANIPPAVTNPPETIEDDVIVKVQIVSGTAKDKTARLKVEFTGLQLSDGTSGHEMPLAWEQVKGNGWTFHPRDSLIASDLRKGPADLDPMLRHQNRM